VRIPSFLSGKKEETDQEQMQTKMGERVGSTSGENAGKARLRPEMQAECRIVKFISFVNVIKSHKNTALISRDHIFQIDVGIFTTVSLHGFQSLLNYIANVFSFTLAVLHSVT
jgi:hypothetical protein